MYHEPPKPEELATLHKVVLATLLGWDMAEGAFVVAIGGSDDTQAWWGASYLGVS